MTKIPPSPQDNFYAQLMLSCWLDTIELTDLPPAILSKARQMMFFDSRIPSVRTPLKPSQISSDETIETQSYTLPLKEPKFLDPLSIYFQKYADGIVDKLYRHSTDILGEREKFIFKTDSRPSERTPAELRAESYPYQIHISLQELAFYDYEDELAFVLSHELVHNAFGGLANYIQTKQEEAMADILGQLIMARAGYNNRGCLLCFGNWDEKILPFIHQLKRTPLSNIPNPDGVKGLAELTQLGLIERPATLPKKMCAILAQDKDPYPADSTRAAYLHTFGKYLTKAGLKGQKLTPIDSHLKTLILERIHKKTNPYKKHPLPRVVDKVRRRNLIFSKQFE